MNYREMKISDYDEIIPLWQVVEGVCLRDADSVEGINKYLIRNPGLSFIAEKGGAVIGTVMSGHDGKRGYIQHLAVATDYRKLGVASKLLNLCMAALKAEGIIKSHIHVLNTNDLGINFWGNRGWRKREDIGVYSFINGTSENT